MATTKDSLLHKFSTDSLSENEKRTFKHYHDTDETFAQKAFDLALIEATYHTTLDEIANKHHKEKPTKRKPRKQLILTISTAAASIIILIGVLFTRPQTVIQNNTVDINTETYDIDQNNNIQFSILPVDTIYLRQKDFLNLPKDIAPVLYANNIEMDKLVAKTDKTTRNSNDIICLPRNNESVIVGKSLNFELIKFKPGTYQLQILAFHENITACNTIYDNNVIITDNNKTAYTWTPQIPGIYYWMLYINSNEPYVVRCLEVLE